MNHFGVKAGIVLAIVMLLCSCSERTRSARLGSQLFFNWLPALLADQSSARSPARLAVSRQRRCGGSADEQEEAMQSVIDRLGNCASMYRQSASGYESETNRSSTRFWSTCRRGSFLAGGTGFVPHSQQSPTLQQDRG